MPASQTSGFPNSQPSSPSVSVNHPTYVFSAPTSVFPAEEPPKPSISAGTCIQKVPQAGEAVVLKPEDYANAMKYCRFASSALQYEDAKTAIENLSKALHVLTNGRE